MKTKQNDSPLESDDMQVGGILMDMTHDGAIESPAEMDTFITSLAKWSHKNEQDIRERLTRLSQSIAKFVPGAEKRNCSGSKQKNHIIITINGRLVHGVSADRPEDIDAIIVDFDIEGSDLPPVMVADEKAIAWREGVGSIHDMYRDALASLEISEGDEPATPPQNMSPEPANQYLAYEFYGDVLEMHITMSCVVEAYGQQTVYDLFYLLGALSDPEGQAFIEFLPESGSRIVELVNDLYESGEKESERYSQIMDRIGM